MNKNVWYFFTIAVFLLSLNPAFAADHKQTTLTPASPEAKPHWTKGLALYKSGEYSEALAELSKYIELTPTSLYALLLRGYTYYKLGNYDQAINDFNNVLGQQNGYEYFAYANLATVYLRNKDYEKARDALHKAEETLAITGEPNEAGALNFILIKPRNELTKELKIVFDN